MVIPRSNFNTVDITLPNTKLAKYHEISLNIQYKDTKFYGVAWSACMILQVSPIKNITSSTEISWKTGNAKKYQYFRLLTFLH